MAMDKTKIPLIPVLPEERDTVAVFRARYGRECRLYRLRIANQEGFDGEEPVGGCADGDRFDLPRDKDCVVHEGWLEVLGLAVNKFLEMRQTSFEGESVVVTRIIPKDRFHYTLYGQLDLVALDRDLAREAKAAEKAAQKALADQAKADAAAAAEGVAQ